MRFLPSVLALAALSLSPGCGSSASGWSPSAAPAGSASSRNNPRASAGPYSSSITYTVSIPDPNRAEALVRVDLVGAPADVADIRFDMPDRYAYVTPPQPLIADVAAASTESGGVIAVRRSGPYAWTLTKGARTRAHMTWRIPLDHRTRADVRAGNDQFEQPYLAADHGMLMTGALFMAPHNVQFEVVRVRFELPDGWDAHAPWPRDDAGAYRVDTAALTHDVVPIGAWSVHTRRIGDLDATIAFAPGQVAIEQTAVDVITKIASYETELFGGAVAGEYAFVFGRPDGPGFGGSPKTNAMALSLGPDLPRDQIASYMAHLIAHEFYHLWGYRRYGNLPDELRFVQEGFTDYYAHLVQARLGFMPGQRLTSELARLLAAYVDNPAARRMSLLEAGGGAFFTEPSAERLVYTGGLAIAAIVDARIRARDPSRSLDDFMRALNNDPRWSPTGDRPEIDDVFALIATFTDPAFARGLRAAVAAPAPVDVAAELTAAGVAVKRSSGPAQLSLRANLTGVTVRELDPGGIAHAVGVRRGDAFVDINGRTPRTARDVDGAWSAPVGGRIRATLRRGGETVTIDAPVPIATTFALPAWPIHPPAR